MAPRHSIFQGQLSVLSFVGLGGLGKCPLHNSFAVYELQSQFVIIELGFLLRLTYGSFFGSNVRCDTCVNMIRFGIVSIFARELSFFLG